MEDEGEHEVGREQGQIRRVREEGERRMLHIQAVWEGLGDKGR
jgi:hypothetical protein